MFARHLRRRRIRPKALRHDLSLLLDGPPTPPLTTRDQLDPWATYALTIYLMSVLNFHHWQQRRVHAGFPSRSYTVPQCVHPTTLTQKVGSVQQIIDRLGTRHETGGDLP